MRIAIVPTIRDFSWGAPGQLVEGMVGSLIRARHEVLLFVAPIDWRTAPVQRLRTLGVHVTKLPPQNPNYQSLARIRGRLFQLRSGPDLVQRLERFAPDHVFINQGGTWCSTEAPFWEMCCAFRHRYSVICHAAQPNVPLTPERQTRALHVMRHAHRVFFNSRWTHEMAETQLAEKITNVRYFQFPLRYTPSAPLPWPANPHPALAIVSRLDTFTKGLDVALLALAQLARNGVQFTLHVYGAGADRDYLSRLVCFLNIGEFVRLVGHVDDVGEIWRREELLLMPSRNEGLGVAMLEALACGRPVLRTPLGGAAEWIVDGQTGYICPAAEPSLLAQTLTRALDDRAKWEQMGIASHQKIKRELSRDPAAVFELGLSELSKSTA